MAKALIILSLFFSFCHAPAQQSDTAPSAALKKLEKVKEALNEMEWVAAEALAQKLVRQYPTWTEGWKVYAEVCMVTGKPDQSEAALRKLVRLDSTGYPEAYRWIAEWTFNRGEYPAARMNIDRYLSLIPAGRDLPYSERLLVSSISYAIGQIEKSASSVPEKISGAINTPDDEYFPSLSVDGSSLVFTRQTRPEKTRGNKVQEDLFYCDWLDSGYLMPEAFPSPINSPGNEGTQSLRQDGRIMFFTACNRPDSKGGCDIYYCVKSGDTWSDPLNLGYPVNSRYWESTPFLAQDGRKLFFASNRPGGHGGMDIWVSNLKADRSWSTPKNLGNQINTPKDEMSPILLVDGKTMFFSSNGHAGMGGFDLYKMDLSVSDESVLPENLGYSVNTFAGEDALTVNADRNIGLFASDRDSLNGKDIYQIDMGPYIPRNAAFTISGTVKDRVSGMPVSSRIEVQPHGDTLISRVESDPVSGLFLLGISERPSYRIGAVAPGYLPYSRYYLNDSTTQDNKIQLVIEMAPIQTGAAIVLNNIFFEVDSYELLPESDQDLNEILSLISQNPGMVIEVSGHTDNTGTDEHNLVLSRKRAEAVMEYLISKGIAPDQLFAKGYGRSNPIDTNESEEGRSRNRRTEIKIVRLK